MHVNPAQLAGACILIFGGAGFIGAHLARRLAMLRAEVVCASRSAPAGRWKNCVTIERCDASDLAAVSRLMDKVRPDLVYQLTSDSRGGGALSLIPDSIRNDVMATVNVLTASAERGTRTVVAGSFEEPIGKADSAVPSSPYAAAKWAGAGYARMFSELHGLPVSVLRVMMTYGPGQKDYKVLPYVIRKIAAGEPAMLSNGARQLDWVYVDDVADAFARAGAAPYPGAQSIPIGSGRTWPLRKLLETVGTMMGRADLLHFGAGEVRRMEREEAADLAPAARLLGWRATTSLEEGLRATIAAYSDGRSP